MLLPSSMRINDPFSMKIEKVEPKRPLFETKPRTPEQRFEEMNFDNPADPTERRLAFLRALPFRIRRFERWQSPFMPDDLVLDPSYIDDLNTTNPAKLACDFSSDPAPDKLFGLHHLRALGEPWPTCIRRPPQESKKEFVGVRSDRQWDAVEAFRYAVEQRRLRSWE